MSDRVETIRTYHNADRFLNREMRRQAEMEAANAYRSLSREEVVELTVLAIEEADEAILTHLICFQPRSLAGRHLALIEEGILYPPVLFFGADDSATLLLVEQINNGQSPNINHSLLALAWADNAIVRQAFQDWRSNPPPWCHSLHVPSHEYALEAGWELTRDGDRRELYVDSCKPLVTPDDPNAVPEPLSTFVSSHEACGWCGQPLTTLLDLNSAHDELTILGLQGNRLRIETCYVCACYGVIFTQVDWTGNSSWHHSNQRPGDLPVDSLDRQIPKENPLLLSRQSRSIMETAMREIPVSFSQLGGRPSWEQNAAFPCCPDCKQRMVFLAQLSSEDYEDMAEGIFYTFICRPCQIAATTYQQT